jgi:alpha-beta hydrolase superfamily lysophospholipase
MDKSMPHPNLYRIPLADDSSNYHYYHRWDASNPRLWIHIMHGMAEHSARYRDLAMYLNHQGISVSADDHRGHGVTGSQTDSLYHLADKDGWNKLLNDQWQLISHIADNQTVPLVVLGHSMGSYMALGFCQSYGNHLKQKLSIPLNGLVLSGSGYTAPALCKIARGLALIERLRLGKSNVSSLLEQLSLGHFNRQFEPTRTPKDWISSDPAVVDNYIEDPWCGGAISTQSWFDFFGGLAITLSKKSLKKLPKHVPIYLFSGDLDPVGKRGVAVAKLNKLLLQQQIQEVQMRLYNGGHHEMLNEVDRNRVFRDLLDWLDKTV